MGDFVTDWHTGKLFSRYGAPFAKAPIINRTMAPAVRILTKIRTRVFQSATANATMGASAFPFSGFDGHPIVIAV